MSASKEKLTVRPAVATNKFSILGTKKVGAGRWGEQDNAGQKGESFEAAADWRKTTATNERWGSMRTAATGMKVNRWENEGHNRIADDTEQQRTTERRRKRECS